MSTLPFYMVSGLKLAELHTFGKLTLQSIGEFLDIEGYEDMTSTMLIEAIEDFSVDFSVQIDNSTTVDDLLISKMSSEMGQIANELSEPDFNYLQVYNK